jgi:6-phospho-3-hexuloisomerase
MRHDRMHKTIIVDKVLRVLETTDSSYHAKLVAMLDRAKRIFVTGAGRSGLITKFFAMRLMHSGYDVHIVGEVVTPSIKAGDLLIIISGSGETEQLVSFARKAIATGARIVLISARPASTIGSLVSDLFQIGAPEHYCEVKGMPMGTVFELSALFFLEAFVAHIIHEKGITEEEMRSRHANLE